MGLPANTRDETTKLFSLWLSERSSFTACNKEQFSVCVIKTVAGQNVERKLANRLRKVIAFFVGIHRRYFTRLHFGAEHDDLITDILKSACMLAYDPAYIGRPLPNDLAFLHIGSVAEDGTPLKPLCPVRPEARNYYYKPQTVSFLSLSAELRNTIYVACLVSRDRAYTVTSPRYGNSQIRKSDAVQPALTRVCRRVRAESLAIFYYHNTFSITLGGPHVLSNNNALAHSWLASIPAAMTQYLRRMVFFQYSEMYDGFNRSVSMKSYLTIRADGSVRLRREAYFETGSFFAGPEPLVREVCLTDPLGADRDRVAYWSRMIEKLSPPALPKDPLAAVRAPETESELDAIGVQEGFDIFTALFGKVEIIGDNLPPLEDNLEDEGEGEVNDGGMQGEEADKAEYVVFTKPASAITAATAIAPTTHEEEISPDVLDDVAPLQTKKQKDPDEYVVFTKAVPATQEVVGCCA